MKTYLIIISALCLSASQVSAVVLAYEPFDDAPGTAVPAGWTGTDHGDSVVAGSLTAPSGLHASTDNKFNMLPGGDYAYALPFTPTGKSTNATVYYSFLLQVNDISSLPTDVSSGPIMALSDTLAKKTAAFSVALDADNSSAYNIGIDASNKGIGGGAITTGTEYTTGTTHFIVVGYTPGGAGAGSVNMWVDPASASFGAGTAPTVTLSEAGGYLTDASNLLLDAQYTNTPNFFIDEIRVGTSWAEVTPAIPEPQTYALILGLGALVGVYIRRRR